MEVYCSNCKYHYSNWSDYCKFKISKDYFGRLELPRCDIKNKKCNCKDYWRKWWKFWINY